MSGRTALLVLDTSRGPELTDRNRQDMGWASFITTFDRPEILRSTIETVFAQTRPPSTLLIVDNGTDPGTPAVVEELGDDRVLYVSTGDNLGSAGGCAFGLKWLAERGFEWVSSIDDDNPPRTLDAIERMRALIERQDSPDLGGVAAQGNPWNWATGQFGRFRDDELHGDLEVDCIGGNGLLTMRRRVIEQVGTPEPSFFFGFYDPLYSLRVKKAGFRLMVDGELMREYRTRAGRLDIERTRAWRPTDPVSGLWRRYYVTRNYIYRMRVSFDRPDLARREAGRALLRSAGSWLRGPSYGARYTSLQLRGVVDGYRGRLGRTVAPSAKTTKHGSAAGGRPVRTRPAGPATPRRRR